MPSDLLSPIPAPMPAWGRKQRIFHSGYKPHGLLWAPESPPGSALPPGIPGPKGRDDPGDSFPQSHSAAFPLISLRFPCVWRHVSLIIYSKPSFVKSVFISNRQKKRHPAKRFAKCLSFPLLCVPQTAPRLRYLPAKLLSGFNPLFDDLLDAILKYK